MAVICEFQTVSDLIVKFLQESGDSMVIDIYNYVVRIKPAVTIDWIDYVLRDNPDLFVCENYKKDKYRKKLKERFWEIGKQNIKKQKNTWKLK